MSDVARERWRSLAGLAKRHPVAITALAVALAALVFFGWRVVDGTSRVARPHEPDLAPWMSPRYVARSWNLPRQAVFDAMEIERGTAREAVPRTIADVLSRTGLTLEELQRRIEAADAEEAGRRDARTDDERER